MPCEHCPTTVGPVRREGSGAIESNAGARNVRTPVAPEFIGDAHLLASADRSMAHMAAQCRSEPLAAKDFSSEIDVDLLIIGGGSAGFAAAIRATELGATVALAEAGALGGTCVNVGCVPSKTLIYAAEVLHRASHHAFAGIRARVEPPDLDALIRQKDELVAELQRAKYWGVLAAYPSILLCKGRATLRPDGAVCVSGKPVRARKVLLAMGARPWVPRIPGLHTRSYLTSTEALALRELPRTMIVIGASAVGVELAQCFARMGTKITVLEVQPRIVPAEDEDMGDALVSYLREEGMVIHTGVAIRQVSGELGAYLVEVDEAGRRGTYRAEQLLVATGRRPNTDGVGLETAGIRLGMKGEVLVDEFLETSRQGVYAAGDAIGDPMLVYVAAYAGALAAENALTGNHRKYDIRLVPRVTFTDPAVAAVGLTEAQARAMGIEVAVSKLPLAHVPRALVARDTRGLVKLVADAKTKLLIGAHILAPEAGEMIMEAALAIRSQIPVDEIATLLHPYLTHAEAIKLACQAFKKDVGKLSCCAS